MAIKVSGTLKSGLVSLAGNRQGAATLVDTSIAAGRMELLNVAAVVGSTPIDGYVDARSRFITPATSIVVNAAVDASNPNLKIRVSNAPGTSNYTADIDGLGLKISKSLLSGETLNIGELIWDVASPSATPAPGPAPNPTPGPTPAGEGIFSVPPVPAGYVTANPTESVDEWLFDNPSAPRYWYKDALGMHDSPGNGAQWPPPFEYGASRSHDRRGRNQDVSTQWARLEPQRGQYVWAGLDEWIDDNPGKTLCFCFFGTPPHQSQSTETWGYGYIRGGASPPTDFAAMTAFTVAMFEHIKARYGRYDIIRYVEPWNEPGNDYTSSSLDSRLPGNKFWTGTPRQLAAMHVAIANGLPAGVKLASCAWEGQHSEHSGSGQLKLIRAMQELGAMNRIGALSKHDYTYNGATSWVALINEMRGHLSFKSKYYRSDCEIIGTETGAEFPVKLHTYSDAARAGWVRCMMGSLIAMGLRQHYFYNYRYPYQYELDGGNNNDFPPSGTLTNAALTQMHRLGGSFVYRCARVGGNKVWISLINPQGVQQQFTWTPY